MPNHFAAFKDRTVQHIRVVNEYKVEHLVLVHISMQHYDEHLTLHQSFLNVDVYIKIFAVRQIG